MQNVQPTKSTTVTYHRKKQHAQTNRKQESKRECHEWYHCSFTQLEEPATLPMVTSPNDMPLSSLPLCLPACLPLLHVSCNYLCLIIICVCVCVAIGCVTFIHYRLGGARLRFQNRFPRERPQRAKDRQPTLATRPTRQWRKKSLRASK